MSAINGSFYPSELSGYLEEVECWDTVNRNNGAADFTEHSEFGDLALPLSHHVGSDADVFARVALLGVGDHQLATANLKVSIKDISTALHKT